MYKYLFFLTASAIPAAAYGQSPSEQALTEIVDRQDADGAATAEVYASAAVPRDAAVITVTANGLGTDLRNTGQSVTVIDRDEIDASIMDETGLSVVAALSRSASACSASTAAPLEAAEARADAHSSAQAARASVSSAATSRAHSLCASQSASCSMQCGAT